jgi:hypothetical protein
MKPPALILKQTAELRDACRKALLRQGERPVIAAVCARCSDPILKEDVSVPTSQGQKHARCVNGPWHSPDDSEQP